MSLICFRPVDLQEKTLSTRVEIKEKGRDSRVEDSSTRNTGETRKFRLDAVEYEIATRPHAIEYKSL